MANTDFSFPPGFLWGTATAAHQVEGGNTNNQWSAWEQAGRVFQGQTSGSACDWWGGEAEEDITRMQDMHTNAHRLSIEWSRIEPREGCWDETAIDRYRAILSAMRRAGITPMITLHHFTNPLWLEERGGWLNPESITLFRRFVRKAVAAFSDLCSTWCTINEPSLCAGQAYSFDTFLTAGPAAIRDYSIALFNLLRAHAVAYHAIHEIQPGASVGLAHYMAAIHPRDPRNPIDRATARLADSKVNRTVLDALKTGAYRPLIGSPIMASQLRNTLDWFGVNYYDRFDIGIDLLSPRSMFLRVGPGQGGEGYPAGLFDALTAAHRCLGLPVYVTENGIPDEYDAVRPGFIVAHMWQVWRAIRAGVPVMGYYHWSLVDNFEWAKGYDSRFRFGLYAVDHTTQARTLKPSGRLYQEICSAGGITSEMTSRYLLPLADSGGLPPVGQAERSGNVSGTLTWYDV